jgi:hypothetical protein
MRRPCEVNPSLPQGVEVLLSKALVGDPTHRPDDLGALASALHILAPKKSIHPPDVDTSTLDKTEAFEVDVSRSLLPPADMVPKSIPIHLASNVPPEAMAKNMPRPAPLPQTVLDDPFGQVIVAPTLPHRAAPDFTEKLLALKARLESDPRPRYVVNKDRMDHGPFTAVELLQQIASNTFAPNDGLRDELSGQSRPIVEWEEFAPFAESAQRTREIAREKKEVARVERAEKTSGRAKFVVSIGVVSLLGLAAGVWLWESRGSRRDDVDIADDQTFDLGDVDAGIKGQHRRGGGGRHGGAGAAGAGSGGAYSPGGLSYEAALAGNNQQITIGQNGGPDLTNAQLEGPLRNGSFISACGASNDTHVTVQVAVRMGRAIGVTVSTNPPNGSVASCIDHAVRGLAWPANPKTDFVTTRY